MYRWAVSRDIVETDPTAGLKSYDSGALRDRVLSEQEIRTLWHWLGESGFPPNHADVLRFQLLTGARCGEAAGILADEVDTHQWLWTLPARRSKNGRLRVTPLIGLAKEIIERRVSQKGPLFPSEQGTPLTASHVGQAILNRRDRLPLPKFSTHDMRRTCATALDALGINLDLIASIVGHEPGTRNTRTLVRHYLRTDKMEGKRIALEAWDTRLRGIVSGNLNSDQNVVPIRQTG